VPSEDSAALAARVLDESERGDLRGLDGALARLAGAPSVVERAWRACLRSAAHFFHPFAAAAPDADEVAAFVGADADACSAAAEACVRMERAAVLAFDAIALGRWIAVHERLVAGLAPDAHITLRAGHLWARVLAGDGASCADEARALQRDAAEARAPAAVIEATALGALAAAADDLDGALEAARRAARMAQSEGLPTSEHLAHLVLARVRRLTARPHLALHILIALARVAPAIWSPWLAWELLLSGGAAFETPGDGPAARAVRALTSLLNAARAGDRPAFDRHAAELLAATEGFRPLRAEADTVLALLDVERPAGSDQAARWCAGLTAETPAGLHALGAAGADDRDGADDAAIACVLARPDHAGRRLLRPGLGLVRGARSLGSEGPAGRGGGRTDTGIAALALAGRDGLPEDEFFRIVYLFAFVRDLHHEVLDTLVRRMRVRLGSGAEIVRREADRAIALRTDAPLLVSDVRCATPAADRILRALAATGPATAEEAADKLRMPLRTVQRAFQQLVEDGALTPRRAGRSVAYSVHDTTFTEITTARRG